MNRNTNKDQVYSKTYSINTDISGVAEPNVEILHPKLRSTPSKGNEYCKMTWLLIVCSKNTFPKTTKTYNVRGTVRFQFLAVNFHCWFNRQMLATSHCWYMIDDTAVGKQCSRLKKLVSGVITPGCLLLLREWHRRVWRLLEQHELVAVKTRVRWRGWRLIICTKNQRIRIRRAESGDWHFITIDCKCVLNLWHPNSFCCAAKSTWII